MIEDVTGRSATLEEEIAKLRAERAAILKENETLQRKNRSLESNNKWLEERLRALIARLYGRRSEKIVPGQLSLPFMELVEEAQKEVEEEQRVVEEEPEDVTPQPRPRRRKGRRPLPENLPRERVVIEPDPEDQVCACCGKQKQPCGQEVTEELDYRPGRFLVREIVRVKMACHDCMEGIVTPPLPPRPIDKGRPGSGLLAHVAVSKYGDHLPLYRQEQIFDREGIDLRRSTLCDWMGGTAGLLEPIVFETRRYILSRSFVQSDDTHVRVRDAETKGATKRGYLWVYCVPWGEVVYDFTLSRGQEGPLTFLQGYRGSLQTDAYGAYNEVFRRGGVVHFGCWAHARRRFYESRFEAPQEAKIVLGFIQALYRVEREAKENALKGDALLSLRQERSKPILEQLRGIVEEFRPRALPQSRLGDAMRYTLGQWDSLVRYADTPDAEIDNNSAENAMRAVVLGRRNWLFLGNAEGGGLRATVFYSLIVSCKRLKVEPFAYLRDVIDRVSTHPASRIWELTPRGWKEARERELTAAPHPP